MDSTFSKAYSPNEIEDKWYQRWLENNIFDTDEHSAKPAFSILMPPPNITGILHFGHVLNITIQDIYIRWKRMQGYESCWFPGTDHAGIATQTRVEKELAIEGKTRYDLGREKFTEQIWQWREKYGNIILNQMKKLGASADWKRTLFTMDESASKAVQAAFIRLFDDGLIYRGKRIINWSPLAQTALSDEEVEHREIREHLYTMKYYFPNSQNYIAVATVRPETIYGDVAVAVNPNDEKYKDYVGKTVIVPFVGREVPIIADDYVDIEFGTGCLKITPAHDINDFEVGIRHNLPIINTINPDGTLNELADGFKGLDRYVARKKIVEKLTENNLIEKIEDYTHSIGFSQRGGEPTEPFLSDQWFVQMQPLAEKALQVVLDGEINFVPEHWLKTYEHWMRNIRDWCISRQLWWGHRIPVYYAKDGRYTAAINPEEARKKLNLSSTDELTQDPDVLDTWFSSWLWPLTTMRWDPDSSEQNEIIKKFLPTDLLVTGPDILFFWVARMIMATEKFANTIPFKNVYFTSTIRDNKGRKLSKSLGNSPDPLNIIGKYGADAVRFTMVYLSPLGQDLRLDVDVKSQDIASTQLGRNFANKIWNAARFIQMKKDDVDDGIFQNTKLSFENLTFAEHWILSRLNSTIKRTNQNLSQYKLNDFSKTLYDFIWRDFCDWYIEIIKAEFSNAESANRKAEIVKYALYIFEKILLMIHPVMPFISEEIWHLLFGKAEDETISTQNYPIENEEYISIEQENDFEIIQLVVEEIRSLRAMLGVQPSVSLPINLHIEDPKFIKYFENLQKPISDLAKISNLQINPPIKQKNAIRSVIRGIEIALILDSKIDLQKEITRIEREIERLQNNIQASKNKLANPQFIEKAAADTIDYEREKLESMQNTIEKVKINLEVLKNIEQ
ncbi:valine--tRNA ligase [bacterium]|nr:valine--tRNA ligase [bacterium]